MLVFTGNFRDLLHLVDRSNCQGHLGGRSWNHFRGGTHRDCSRRLGSLSQGILRGVSCQGSCRSRSRGQFGCSDDCRRKALEVHTWALLEEGSGANWGHFLLRVKLWLSSFSFSFSFFSS